MSVAWTHVITVVLTSILTTLIQAGEAVSLGGGSKTTPKPTFAIAQAFESAPIFEVIVTIIVFFVFFAFLVFILSFVFFVFFLTFLTIDLRPPGASLPWHSPIGQSSSVGQKYLTWTPGQVLQTYKDTMMQYIQTHKHTNI